MDYVKITTLNEQEYILVSYSKNLNLKPLDELKNFYNKSKEIKRESLFLSACKIKNLKKLYILDKYNEFINHKKNLKNFILSVYVYKINSKQEAINLFCHIQELESDDIKETDNFSDVLKLYKDIFIPNKKYKNPPRVSLLPYYRDNLLKSLEIDDISFNLFFYYLIKFDKKVKNKLLKYEKDIIDKNWKKIEMDIKYYNLINLFTKIYNSSDRIENQYKLAKEHGSFLGSFSIPLDDKKKLSSIFNKVFWEIVS